jgi:hypothetical protein
MIKPQCNVDVFKNKPILESIFEDTQGLSILGIKMRSHGGTNHFPRKELLFIRSGFYLA